MRYEGKVVTWQGGLELNTAATPLRVEVSLSGSILTRE
jgi:hypothetical protein